MKTNFLLAILVVAIDLSIGADNRSVIEWPATARLANSTQQVPTARTPVVGGASQRESLDAAPTITSVHHQVWTSSSSGRLDELSPELIGKLRQDVPFLAAYALRPRLVGQPQQQQSTLVDGDQVQQAAASKAYETLIVNNQDVGRGGSVRNDANPLQMGASTPQASRQSLGQSRLGDFSEFKVETSSLSKSEHHHKRSTSLKRPNSKLHAGAAKRSARARAGRKLREDSLSQLVRRLKKGRHSSANRKRFPSRRGARDGSGTRRKRGRRAGKRRARRQRSGLKRSRSSRLLQDRKVDETNDLDSETNRSGIKGGDVKGGGQSGGKKTPFFAAGLKPKMGQNEPTAPTGTASGDGNDIERDLDLDEMKQAVGGEDTSRDDEAGNSQEDGDDSGESEREPKRVGDEDVEEDGDTVLVEPKSDGVDDDPELPSAEDDNGDDSDLGGNKDEASVNTVEDKAEEGTVTTASPSQGDVRGNRVNRQRPNELPPTDDGDQDQVIGGGVGATTGSGSSPASSGSSTGLGGSGGSDDESEDRRGGAGATPGVEFAEDGAGRSKESGRGEGIDDRNNGKESPSDDDQLDRRNPKSDDASDGNFGERTRSGQEADSDSPRSSGGEGIKRNEASADDDLDLDYRDEQEPTLRSDNKPTTNGDRNAPRGEHPTRDVNASRAHPKATGENCDDGSYDHHDDHHHHHHHHHDTIDWLRGAIPGEPGVDYPILSRANATNFSCADQKFPGYYADVDASCQIFHICQADGRQDSFLCPNGTIFSQRSLVCVWWNGFHCEDAPKFYHLNELLYKTTNGNESPQSAALPNLRPLDGSRQHPSPRAMDMAMAAHNDDDDEGAINSSPIDSPALGRKPHEANFRGGETGGVAAGTNRPGGISSSRGQVDARDNNIAPADDATIQRKSTNLDYDSLDEPQQASKSVSRRRRRASMRQAPPKLKSRRVSRNSRRAKLRHGIKPRRRA